MTREEAIKILRIRKEYATLIKEDVLQEALDMAIEALQSTMSQERVNHESTNDLISRADAKQQISEWATIITKPTLLDKDATMVVLDALPSAVCDDCIWHVCNYNKVDWDALPSAEAEWIPFKKRPLTDEEKQEYPDWTYIFDCPLPDDEEEILLSNGKYVWTDTFINDGECYLDGGDDIDDGMAWMPLPKPYKGGAE